MTRYSRKRTKQDIHYLTEENKVACNPRDQEAAHRAEVENIAAEDFNNVTFKKCWSVIHRTGKYRKSSIQ